MSVQPMSVELKKIQPDVSQVDIGPAEQGRSTEVEEEH